MVVVVRAAAVTFFLAAGLPFAAAAQTCVPDTTPDWMVSIPLDQSSAQVRPADCATVQQTPPDFSWPELSTDAQYHVTLTYPDGHTRSNSVAHNWINWDEVLPAGAYTWQVQVTNASGTQTSRARRFTVDASAVPFLVPEWTTLFDRAAAKPRPRALPDPAMLQAMISQRRTELGWLYAIVDANRALPLQPEPSLADPKGWGPGGILENTNTECRRTLEAALAWLVTAREEYLAEALRRALNLAAWDPSGSTSYANVDQASRQIAWTLTIAYDWLHARLDASQKNLLLTPISIRATDMYNDIIGSRARVAIHPYDSHRSHTLIYLAVIAVLLAGDIPEAQIGVRDALPLALHWTSPWGGEDGGFGNGTAYAHYVAGDTLIPWNVLRWTVGVDMAQKAWVRNYGRYIAYFLPPGTPVGAFGDGAELHLREIWGAAGRAYTLFAPSPLGRWYASQLTGGTRRALSCCSPRRPI